jgi:signal transduction histidine kinase/DNA-binding response OmpR family regulator
VVDRDPGDGGERLLVYTRVGSANEQRVAYGFEYDPRGHAELFQSVLEQRRMLPEPLMKGRSNTDLLAVQILSPAGRVLFASDSEEEWSHASSDPFEAHFGGLQARATVRPAVAGSLVIGGLPRSRLPFLIGLLILAAGLSAMAVSQLRREGELARLRSDFVSSVSHELRTPLAQVRLFLETLRLGRYSTDEQREWILDNMERETTRLNSLIDNVLHFSRAERGATGGDKETICLAEYLERLVRDFAPLAAARRVRFETRLEPGLFAPLHAESFRQVILNLLDNAVKYGPQGQTVRVATVAMADGVRVLVEDEGPGIRPHERLTIWEPFRRGEHAIGSVAVGSGIGLAVVREIVEWHEGVAWVEDAPEGGARFVVHLPGWRDPLRWSGGNGPSSGELTRAGRMMARILLVEDNAELAAGIRYNLELDGYDVRVAEDGPAGVQAAREFSPDLIILDLMLPGMDGFQVLRTLREECIQVPVLVLTARGEEADKVRAFRLDADQYVTKPFGLLELLERVGTLLRRARLKAAPAGDEPDGILHFGEVVVDPGARKVVRRGSEVTLTPRAFDLLLALVALRGRVASRQMLLERCGDTRGGC